MAALALITDSTADIPAGLAIEAGVSVVQARAAFEEHAFNDDEQPASALYARMRAEQRAPRPFGVPEPAFKAAFAEALAQSPEVLCLVMPFDVSPSFTTASAAMLSLETGGIKILNPGVASAGLCSFVLSLSAGVRGGWTLPAALAAVDKVEPLCDTLFVPSDITWLERAGRLQLIEDRLGEIGGGLPVVRVGTRITGVAIGDSHELALKKAVDTAGRRAGDETPVIATIDHADAPELADHVAGLVRDRWNVEQVVITELSATIGSQMGPGAVGIGIAPVERV